MVFQATAGSSFAGDIALDDVQFNDCGPGCVYTQMEDWEVLWLIGC